MKVTVASITYRSHVRTYVHTRVSVIIGMGVFFRSLEKSGFRAAPKINAALVVLAARAAGCWRGWVCGCVGVWWVVVVLG